MKVCIIGMGEIGFGLYSEMSARNRDELVGVDINPARVQQLRASGVNIQPEIPRDSDIYIICVLLTEQVEKILVSGALNPNALVVVESTIAPGTSKRVLKLKPFLRLVVFPHRYNADTQQIHGFLTLNAEFNRVIGGGNASALESAIEFYSNYLDPTYLHITSLEVAELCKPLENAYRYIQIAFAEELKLLCDTAHFDFEAVRNAMNTKWNVNVLEARDGIGKHCLPKDIQLINSHFPTNRFFRCAMEVDATYRKTLQPLLTEKIQSEK